MVDVADHGIVIKTQGAALLKNVFTHLLRNSVDHGLEPAAERVAAGKPATGRIALALDVAGDTARLVLQDDGRGLALDRIRAKAVAQGLVADGEQLADAEVAQLIFASGFSTADQVTEVSGRGVGMDAVRGFLNEVGGDAAIELLPAAGGAGRPFRLVVSLPRKFVERT